MAPNNENEGPSPAEGSGEGAEKPISPDGPSLGGRLKDIWNNPNEGLFGQPTGKKVFDKAKQTVTGKNAYEVERAEQDFKLLDPKSMTKAEALAGLKKGTHQTNHRGDSVENFHKNRFKFVTESEFMEVKGEQREQITGIAQLTYKDDRVVVVGAHDDLSVKGMQTIFVLGTSSEQYVGKHEVTAPEDFEWKQLESGFTAISIDMKALDFSVTGAASEFNVLETSVEGVKAFMEGLHEGAKGHEGHAIALRDEAIPVEPVLIVRVNLLVQVCIITPFG